MARRKWYVVWRGKKAGIYTDWSEVSRIINEDPSIGNSHKSYTNYDEAFFNWDKAGRPGQDYTGSGYYAAVASGMVISGSGGMQGPSNVSWPSDTATAVAVKSEGAGASISEGYLAGERARTPKISNTSKNKSVGPSHVQRSPQRLSQTQSAPIIYPRSPQRSESGSRPVSASPSLPTPRTGVSYSETRMYTPARTLSEESKSRRAKAIESGLAARQAEKSQRASPARSTPRTSGIRVEKMCDVTLSPRPSGGIRVEKLPGHVHAQTGSPSVRRGKEHAEVPMPSRTGSLDTSSSPPTEVTQIEPSVVPPLYGRASSSKEMIKARSKHASPERREHRSGKSGSSSSRRTQNELIPVRTPSSGLSYLDQFEGEADGVPPSPSPPPHAQAEPLPSSPGPHSPQPSSPHTPTRAHASSARPSPTRTRTGTCCICPRCDQPKTPSKTPGSRSARASVASSSARVSYREPELESLFDPRSPLRKGKAVFPIMSSSLGPPLFARPSPSIPVGALFGI